ncbi:hypothetical protein CAPTEDRAFT_204559 [Capitella teleta]|uniref:NACHT domain-containing protein n=1 Tax=Capitella teleta TaxID=283909 RepID=R7TVT4_CAPTE|nr:hypothetical protein CAPTEDRAFT_204559 [Capitella teleta]|eukprot:ELT98013.1 hypothetical protein CAPTEDRAFT_204559 [Capitella teleta]
MDLKSTKKLATTSGFSKYLSFLAACQMKTSFDAASLEGEGIHPETHEDYIKDFCEHFYEKVTRQVTNTANKYNHITKEPLQYESLQHLHLCLKLCKLFKGRNDFLSGIQAYLGSKSRQPYLLFGKSGCGNISILAKAFSQFGEQYTDVPGVIGIVRFLGTTPSSSTVMSTLRSLCQQICVIYNLPTSAIPYDLISLTRYFKDLLEEATQEKPMLIFFDAIDQLSDIESDLYMPWLPVTLPPHVKIVTSVLPNHLLTKLQKRIPTENTSEAESLGNALGMTILTSWLQAKNRTVSQKQLDIIDAAVKNCSIPLYINIVFNEIINWNSYNPIEKDVLSLDDDILNDVYQFHLPPVRRIPPLLWMRIMVDLKRVFIEREADDATVINWYHRQYQEAAHKRFLKNANYIKELHSKLADYFSGKWGAGRKKPYSYTKEQIQCMQLDLSYQHGESDRMVPSQPLYFKSENGTVSRFNKRHLNELPFHLLRAERIDELHNDTFFNFPFLYAKVSCIPLQTLLCDMAASLSNTVDKDVQLLVHALRLSSSMVSKFPDMLGIHISARLLPYYKDHKKIRRLVDQCDSKGLGMNSLVPAYQCLHTPGGALVYTLEGHPFAPFGMVISSDAAFLMSASNIFTVWNLVTGEISKQIDPQMKGIVQGLCLSPDDAYAACYTTNNLIISLTPGGDITKSNIASKWRKSIVGVKRKSDTIIIWTADEWFELNLTLNVKTSSRIPLDYHTIVNIIPMNSISGEWAVILQKDDKDQNNMLLQFIQNTTPNLEFRDVSLLTKDLSTIYCCVADDQSSV